MGPTPRHYSLDFELFNAKMDAPVNSQIINRATDERPYVDNILMQYLKDFKSSDETSSKSVDENDEPHTGTFRLRSREKK